MASVRKRLPVNEDLKSSDFQCCICFEILKSPVELPCSHLFCSECISMISGDACPYCRKGFNKIFIIPAIHIEQTIKIGSAKCQHCDKKVLLRNMQHHLDGCIQEQNSTDLKACLKLKHVNGASSASSTGLSIAAGISQPRQGKPRITHTAVFYCPFCSVQNLDRRSLLEHVLARHKNGNQQLVCPICASMPWGDPNYKSGNLSQHLMLRHQMDFDHFVEFGKDEDETLKEVLVKSMYDC